MSVRLLTHRLFNHGRLFIQNFYSHTRNIHLNILEPRTGINRRAVSAQLRNAAQTSIASQTANKNAGLFRFGLHARRLFVDNILNRVTTTYSANLRNEATKKLLYGDAAPFFSLVGVSLATGNGLLTKDDELEGVCWEIREAVSRLQSKWGKEEISKTIDENFGLNDLDIGPPIAKGCAAVVYAAAIKDPSKLNTQATSQSPPPLAPDSSIGVTSHQQLPRPIETMSPIQNTSRFIHNFGGSVDNVNFSNSSGQIDLDLLQAATNRSLLLDLRHQSMRQRFDSISEMEIMNERHEFINQNDHTAENNIANKPNDDESTKHEHLENKTTSLIRYPLALKMMFNYDIQSNAMAILRAMYKETIPSRNKRIDTTVDSWEKILMEQTVNLPPHPNIVLMFGVFCDQIPNLDHGASLYPMALPPRINPQGYGRNMSLFLLMKRYHYRLCEYLENLANLNEEENSKKRELSMRTRILLFAQLLEAVAHLHRYGVAHRDLKSDNILIDLNNDDEHPVLVLSDFGCCLADRTNGLHLPYTSHDIDKGGNTALMAPEIIQQVPGTFSILNYTKSDLWACGTIAYEIFGNFNPFYGDPNLDLQTNREKTLRNVSYNEIDLPSLGKDVPPLIKSLVDNILQRNPRKRMTPDVAANVMQLFLWAPSGWLRPNGMPTSTEILQWMLSLTTKVLCHGPGHKEDFNVFGGTGGAAGGCENFNGGRRTYTEYLLISSFLVRAKLESVRSAADWIQNIVS